MTSENKHERNGEFKYKGTIIQQRPARSQSVSGMMLDCLIISQNPNEVLHCEDMFPEKKGGKYRNQPKNLGKGMTLFGDEHQVEIKSHFLI